MTEPPILIAPSLLSADFAHLAEELADVEAGGADWHHVDVMDGHFVPNLTIGPPVVARIHRVAKLPLDVHLMISDPAAYAEAFARAGAHVLVFHLEVAGDEAGARSIARRFRAEGVAKVGIAVNPETPIEGVEPLLDELDLVLVMSVSPGFGGQAFREDVLSKVRRLRDLGYDGHVEMDGGIDGETALRCVEAGCDVLVAGTAIYGAPDRAGRIALLREAAEGVRRRRAKRSSPSSGPEQVELR